MVDSVVRFDSNLALNQVMVFDLDVHQGDGTAKIDIGFCVDTRCVHPRQ